MVESPTRKISGAVRSELQPRLVSRAKCRVTDPGANPDEKTDEARTPLGKSWPAPETVSTGSGKRNHVQRRLAVKPWVGHEGPPRSLAWVLLQLRKGVQPRTSHGKLYRFYVTDMSSPGSISHEREEGTGRMFGIWQVPMTDSSIFSGAWSLCEPYRSFT